MTEENTENVADTDVEIEDDKALEFLRTGEAPKEEVAETEEVAEEVKEEPKEEPKEEKPKYVPLEALHEERAKRRELKERLDKQEQRFQEFMQRLQPKEEAPQFQNEEQRLRYEQQQIAEQVKQQNHYIEQQRLLAQQQQQEQSVIRTYASKAKEFSEKTPDFGEAYNFLYQSRQAELVAAGYPVEGDTKRGLLPLDEYLKREELSIAQAALMDEVNPAERVYAIAKARGFQAKKPEAKDKLQTIEKGMKANRSLSGVSGSSPKGMTLEALAEMDDEDFAKLSYEEIQKIANQ